MGGLLKAKRIVLFLVIACLTGLSVAPILVMLSKSLVIDGRFNLTHYASLFSVRTLVLLRQSLLLSTITSIIAALIGIPLGILFSRTDLPLRRLLTVLFTLPFLLPPYIIAFCWSLIMGRKVLGASLFGPAFSEDLSAWFFGLPGCAVTLTTTFMPIVMLLTMTYARTINPRLEEAARIFAAWPKVIMRITIPFIKPGILLSIMLVFLLTMGEFSVTMFFRYDVFAVESFLQFSAFYSFGAATAAAMPLVMITLFALMMERIFLLEKSYYLRPGSIGAEQRIRIGALKWPCFALVSLLGLLFVVLPLFIVLFNSGYPAIYYSAISKAADSIMRSIAYGALGASVLVILGFFSGYLIRNKVVRFWRGVDTLTVFFFALPSPVIGIGLISLWNRPGTSFVYETFLIIILGYMIQYAALTSRITVSALTLIPASMEEAARMAGAGWIRRMAFIVVPLTKRGLVAGWLVGYIFCLRDTGIAMMVYPPGYDTLPVRTFTLMANNPTHLIAALCVTMIGATLIPLGALALFLRQRG